MAQAQVMPCPDLLRRENLDGGAAARAAIMRVREAGGRVCAFFSESILSCGGQVVLPPGYLQVAASPASLFPQSLSCFTISRAVYRYSPTRLCRGCCTCRQSMRRCELRALSVLLTR